MNKIELYGRPFALFNAADVQHRQWFLDFLKNGTWGYCPVRFVVEDNVSDLVTQCQRSLNKFYLEQEFEKV